MTKEMAIRILEATLPDFTTRFPPSVTPRELAAAFVLSQLSAPKMRCGDGVLELQGYTRDSIVLTCPNCDQVSQMKASDPMAFLILGAGHGQVLAEQKRKRDHGD